MNYRSVDKLETKTSNIFLKMVNLFTHKYIRNFKLSKIVVRLGDRFTFSLPNSIIANMKRKGQGLDESRMRNTPSHFTNIWPETKESGTRMAMQMMLRSRPTTMKTVPAINRRHRKPLTPKSFSINTTMRVTFVI